MIYNELVTKLLGKEKNGEWPTFQKSVSLVPQGGPAKSISMFFYLKEGTGKEPEVG